MKENRHCLVTGPSGNGKTTLLREYHSNWSKDGISIWINHNKERVQDARSSDRAISVNSSGELINAINEGKTMINFNARQLNGLKIGRSMGYHVSDKPVQLILDECHNCWPKKFPDEQNQVSYSLQEDRDEQMRLLFSTQSPQNLKPYQPLQNIRWLVWCGPPNGFQQGFLDYHSWIPNNDLPTKQFDYVTFDKQGSVVTRGETKEEFA